MKITELTLDADGIATHVLRGGSAKRSVLFLHGGSPGIAPYCGGAHVWAETLEAFAADSQVAAFDMIGCGATGWHSSGGPITVDHLGEHALRVLDLLDLPDCHIVGHDIGGLIALWLAMKAPERMRSISIMASQSAAPRGDWVDDLVYLDPPPPLYSRKSQLWALDRVSCAPHHITPALLDACEAAAGQPGVRAGQEAMASPEARAFFNASVSRTNAKAWALSRDAKLGVPFQVIWGADDPLTTPAHGMTLFQTLGRTQPEAQFHLFNRCGSFVFREQPERFRRVVEAFRDGLAATPSALRYA